MCIHIDGAPRASGVDKEAIFGGYVHRLDALGVNDLFNRKDVIMERG